MTTLWAGRLVLVTGAGGFIGSHLAGRLVDLGADVRAFVRYTSGRNPGLLVHEPRAAEIDLRFGDLRDYESVRRAVEGVETVVHLGAHVGIPYSYEAPRDVIETNVLGTLNVLLAAREADGPRVVCTSTSEVYGSPEALPIDEGQRLCAQSPYAASKVAADALAEAFRRSYGVETGIVRPFNTYGPRQSARAVIPTILSQALAGGPVRLGTVETVRDFTYVEDTVEGILALAAADGLPGRTVQLGSGTAVSVAELVEIAGQIVGRPLEVVTDDERVRPPDSEVDALQSDPSAARELAGWQATTPLREGMERTAEWIGAHLDDYPHPAVYAR